ncbi:Dimodular nonribosomal peptide synthase [Kordia antarctica]|uniref:Dimodular nonribosomal peptide synthase n=1 Tax=Kordia antarctica TaxID=1218801 RepID=A0A7L4ZHN3_9FLAO|nr:non-ribosomal peptide synthetase [Kordia antarctica]QHI35434.1 Dimodular nonribosomal peptide synthase [Kordia antarctica]
MRLTLAQQDIYYEYLMYPEAPIHNIGAKINIEGKIDFNTLDAAYHALINQHDSYRSYLVFKGNEVTINIHEKFNSPLEFIDFSNESEAETVAEKFMKEDFQVAFQLNEDTILHRFILIKINETHSYLYSKYHHIITDGWGTSLMFQRFVANYNELIEKSEIETDYPFSYIEYVKSDVEYINSESYAKDANYWKEKFSNLPENVLKKLDPNKDIVKSKREELYIPRSIYNKIIEVSKEKRVSTFHFILGILYVYFSKRYQKESVVIGIPVLNRKSAKFKKTVGLFMGVTPLKIEVDVESTFNELLETIKKQLRADYRHQQFPLGKLISELGLSAEKRKLFNIMLSYEKQDYSNHFKDTKTTVVPMTHEAERVGLAIYIREFDALEDIKIDFDYNTNHFDASSIKQVVTHMNDLIHNVLKDPSQKLLAYNYISSSETQTLLNTYNDTNVPFDLSETTLSKLNTTAKEHLEKVAIKDNFKSFTYQEVINKSNKIASFLQEKLQGNTTPIAVLMDRSSELIITLLAIMKSGRAFIPLDPNFPKERLEYIIKHSKVSTLIATTEMQGMLDTTIEFLNVDTFEKLPENFNELQAISSDKTAYIIYTSGSTGKPKGVEIGHKSLLNFLLSIQQQPGITSNDVLYSVTTQSFDISILEFFLPLIAGATLYVANKEILQDPKSIIKEIEVLRPSIIQATPSFYQMLYNAGWKGNTNLKVLCGGDLLNEMLAEKLLLTNQSLWNMYGPTETTIWSSIKHIKKASQASNIGKPIHNTHFYILDAYNKLLPTHTDGKIYIGGKGLAKGYYLDASLTNEKFITNPFNVDEKIYETGDLGRWNSDGEIEFLGRDDQQVKIRGFRIELGDIETQLNNHSAVEESVVIAKKSAKQNAFLVAYIIAKKEKIDTNEIIRFLQKKLPNYMVPYTIIELHEFPLTFNKKINRKQLEQKENINKKDEKQLQEAQNEMQEIIYSFYQKVLELDENFNITDSFFALGGHSLNAIRLIGHLEETFGYKLSLKELFDKPDIISLSEYLESKDGDEKKRKEILSIAVQPFYPVTFPQYAIWLASIQSEKSIAYNMYGAYVIQGEVDLSIMQQVFEEVIDRYEVLRTNFIEVDGVPYQKIKSTQEVSFEIDRSFLKVAAYEDALKKYLNKEFDLEKDSLIRAAVFHMEDAEDQFVFATHHVIVDGWSLELMIKELTDRYIAIKHNEKLDLPALNYQFKDYVKWQNDFNIENELRNRAFWTTYLKKYTWEPLVPYDKVSSEDKYLGDFYMFNWDKNFLGALKTIAIQNEITLHTLLMASFHIILNKMYNLEDICLGTINSGRTYSGLHNQLGMFVKTLPLRSHVKPETSFLEFAQEMHQNLLSVDEHQDLPEDILNTLRFEAILVLQNETFNYAKVEVTDNLTFKSSPVIAEYNRLPLNIDFAMTDEYLRGSILYDTSKYDKETLDVLTLKHEKLLREIILEIQQPIHAIDIELDLEKEEIIDIDFNF